MPQMTARLPTLKVTSDSGDKARLVKRIVFLGGLLLYGLVLARTAWVGEDAFITLRSVDNFVNGYGPVWNTDERVQAFTHPLWMLVLSAGYAITREALFTTLGISMALSLLAVGLILWQFRDAPQVLLPVVAAVVGSKAFLDYSTSGLENPLSHVLIVAVIVLYAQDRQRPRARNALWMALIAGLAVFNRMDTALIVLPAVAERSLRLQSADRIKAWLMLATPMVAWMAFSTFYYGFPFPNTYYAKQAAGIPRAQYLERGWEYAAHLVTHDPLTAAVIVTGALGVFLTPAGRRLWPIASGILLYLAYIIWSGGDFMQGRFFSPILIASAASAAYAFRHLLAARRPAAAALTVGIVLLGLAARPVPNLLSDQNYPRPLFNPSMRIVDERGFYYWGSGLLPAINSGGSSLSQMPWVRQGIRSRQIQARLHVFGEIGFRGYFAGPTVKFVDPYALADAFLAHLPYFGSSAWRIGHITRVIPPGYLETRLTGQNHLKNENLRQLYDQLDLITRGPLWSIERLQAIVAFNLKPPRVLRADLDGATEDLTFEQFAQGIHRVNDRGLRIFLPAGQQRLPGALLLRGDAGTGYTLLFLEGGTVRESVEFPAYFDRPADEPVAHYITTDGRYIGDYDTLRLVPRNPGPHSSAGLLHIVPDPFLVRTRIPRVYGITLSSTVGLVFSQPYSRVEGRRMAGLWEADAGHDLTLSLSLLPHCDEKRGQRAVVKVNRAFIASHTWPPQNCAQAWDTEVLIPAAVIEAGTNVIEIESDFATRPLPQESAGISYISVAIEKLRIAVSSDH